MKKIILAIALLTLTACSSISGYHITLAYEFCNGQVATYYTHNSVVYCVDGRYGKLKWDNGKVVVDSAGRRGLVYHRAMGKTSLGN